MQLLTVAHGVAALLISRPYLPFGDVEEFADRVMRSACGGHIVHGLDRRSTMPPQQTVEWR